LIAKKRKKRNRNWQLFFAIVLYACCLYKIITNLSFTVENLQNTVFSFLNEVFFYRLFSIFLLTINTIALVFVMRRQEMVELRNYIPAVCYLLLSFIFSDCLNPLALFAGLVFIVGIFRNLFDLEEHNINQKMFQHSFCVGILTLIYFPFIALLLFACLSGIIYRRMNFRIFCLSIMGVFLPVLYWYSTLYVIGYDFSLSNDIQLSAERLLHFQFFNIIETPFTLIVSILLILTGLKSMHKLWTASGKTSVLRRKKYYILMVLLLFSIGLTFLYSQFYMEITLLAYSIVLSLQIKFSTLSAPPQ